MVRLSLICGLLCDLIRLLLRLNSFISQWFYTLSDKPLVCPSTVSDFPLFFDPVKVHGTRKAHHRTATFVRSRWGCRETAGRQPPQPMAASIMVFSGFQSRRVKEEVQPSVASPTGLTGLTESRQLRENEKGSALPLT